MGFSTKPFACVNTGISVPMTANTIWTRGALFARSGIDGYYQIERLAEMGLTRLSICRGAPLSATSAHIRCA